MFRVKALFAAALLLAVTLMSSSVARAQGNSEAAKLHQLNNQLLQLYGQLTAANSSNGNSLRSQASAVIAERFAALQTLIKTDPMTALQFGFDSDLLAALKETFPASAAQFEAQGTWTGPVDYLIFDDPTLLNHRVDLNMKVAGEVLKLHFKDPEPTWFKCSDILTVSGMKAGAEVAAADGSVSGSVAPAGSCSTLGDQKTLVILVNMIDDPNTATVEPASTLPSGATKTMLEKIYFTGDATNTRSLNDFWRDASYGKASASGVVVGPVSIVGIDCGNYYGIRDAAIAAANAADPSLDLLQFNRIAIIFPGAGCGWAGLGNLGCGSIGTPDGTIQASTVWNVATYMQSIDQGIKLASHEGGHNLTLHHASTRYFTNATTGLAEPLGPYNNSSIGGTHDEYGDTHSAMGSWNLGHYAAPHKAQIGWLAASNIQTVESNGSFSIQPYENVTPGVQALKVRRGTGNSAWLWMEFRQNVGLYDSTLGSQIKTGALIHHVDNSTGTYTHLVDFTPATGNTFSDAAKPAGSGTYVDPYTNLSFSVDSISNPSTPSAAALNLTVNYGPVPCTPSNPTVSITPGTLSGGAGAGLVYTVNVTNNDSSGCAGSAFVLSSTLPAGWSTTFGAANATLNIAPGSSASSSMTKTIPGGTPAGSNSVNVVVNRGVSQVGSATATANVVVAPTTTMNSITPTVATTRDTVTMTATSSIGGSSVKFTMTKANGSVTTKTVTAGANGVAVWSYRLAQKDPKGLYSVTAQSTANGLQGPPSPTPMTFTVQ